MDEEELKIANEIYRNLIDLDFSNVETRRILVDQIRTHLLSGMFPSQFLREAQIESFLQSRDEKTFLREKNHRQS